MDNSKKGTDIAYGIVSVPDKTKPADVVEKYWGNMFAIFENDNFCVKRIFMKKDSQSSLEYHVKKKEMYFIESGTLKVGLRVGRAKNTSLILEKGEIFHINPGLMHMRMALEDTVIIEVSTKDDDSDSHIVEDGTKYTHKENL
jgi:mannose-6-phosphate isomerase|tara:strand:- start:53 stop:481 length:429 start_codon:yes stop_codon:yes gene_type:complete